MAKNQKHKYVTCKECNQWKVDRGRGLCYSCKRRLIEWGSLDIFYPAYASRKPKKPEPEPEPLPAILGKPSRREEKIMRLEGGHWVKKPGGIKVWVDDEVEQDDP